MATLSEFIRMYGCQVPMVELNPLFFILLRSLLCSPWLIQIQGGGTSILLIGVFIHLMLDLSSLCLLVSLPNPTPCFGSLKNLEVIPLNPDINLYVSFTIGTRIILLFQTHKGVFGNVYGSWRFRVRSSIFYGRLAQTRCLPRIIYGSGKFWRKQSVLAMLVFRRLLNMLYGVVIVLKLFGIQILDGHWFLLGCFANYLSQTSFISVICCNRLGHLVSEEQVTSPGQPSASL